MNWFIGFYLAIGLSLLCGFLVIDFLRGDHEPLGRIWKACVLVVFAWPVGLWLFFVKEDAR